MSFLFYFFLVIFLIGSFLLSLIILFQDSSNSGLGSSLGGSGQPDRMFGPSAVNVVQKFTAYLAIFFMVGAIVLASWGSS